MKFVVNRFNVNFHARVDDDPPVQNVSVERRPFGIPPREFRDVWTVEVPAMATLLTLADTFGWVDVSLSAYWTGDTLEVPGKRLPGIALVDDPRRPIDPRDRPILLVRDDEPERWP